MTFTGQCSFTLEIIEVLEQQGKGLLSPVMKVAKDMTFAPDLGASGKLYKVLDKHWRLAGVGDSLQFYQTVLSSIEHTCPGNMTREIDSCHLKKWLTFGGILEDDSMYDRERLKRWFETHPSIQYLIVGSAELYNSKALLNSRYSASSRVITEVPTSAREPAARPFLGKLRLDWVLPNASDPVPFKSYGYCGLSWEELEQKRRQQGPGWLTTAQLAEVNKMMMPYFTTFLDKVSTSLTVTR